MAVKTVSGFIEIESRAHNEIYNITEEVNRFIHEKKLREGQLLIFINGSTAAISTVEYEPGLLKDIPETLEKLAPVRQRYRHDDTWHDGNGYAHVRSTLMGTSLTIRLIAGRSVLGTWQQIILLDFDNKRRRREVTLQFVGKAD